MSIAVEVLREEANAWRRRVRGCIDLIALARLWSDDQDRRAVVELRSYLEVLNDFRHAIAAVRRDERERAAEAERRAAAERAAADPCGFAAPSEAFAPCMLERGHDGLHTFPCRQYAAWEQAKRDALRLSGNDRRLIEMNQKPREAAGDE